MLFVHGWVLGADMWEYKMTPLATQGLRCIAYDLRGAGCSDQPGHGYDPETLAGDLAAVIGQLDLQQVTLVGHSMGSAQIVRYLAGHHADPDRVARVVFVATTLPFLRKTDNPDGVDGAVFEETLAVVGDDRPQFAAGVADVWFGNGLPGVAVSPELQQWLIGLFLQASPRAAIDMFRAFTQADFHADLAAVKVPTLLIHGDSDAMSPFQPGVGPPDRGGDPAQPAEAVPARLARPVRLPPEPPKRRPHRVHQTLSPLPWRLRSR